MIIPLKYGDEKHILPSVGDELVDLSCPSYFYRIEAVYDKGKTMRIVRPSDGYTWARQAFLPFFSHCPSWGLRKTYPACVRYPEGI